MRLTWNKSKPRPSCPSSIHGSCSRLDKEQTKFFSRWTVQKVVDSSESDVWKDIDIFEDMEVFLCFFKTKLMVHAEVAAKEPHQTAQTSLAVFGSICTISQWCMFPILDAGGPWWGRPFPGLWRLLQPKSTPSFKQRNPVRGRPALIPMLSMAIYRYSRTPSWMHKGM